MSWKGENENENDPTVRKTTIGQTTSGQTTVEMQNNWKRKRSDDSLKDSWNADQ